MKGVKGVKGVKGLAVGFLGVRLLLFRWPQVGQLRGAERFASLLTRRCCLALRSSGLLASVLRTLQRSNEVRRHAAYPAADIAQVFKIRLAKVFLIACNLQLPAPRHTTPSQCRGTG